jgi:hypothetical protein
MVRHWQRLREPGWQRSVAINAVGAALTAAVLIVIVTTKFSHGAWAVLVLLPILVLVFGSVHRHYVNVAKQLSLEKSATGRAESSATRRWCWCRAFTAECFRPCSSPDRWRPPTPPHCMSILMLSRPTK